MSIYSGPSVPTTYDPQWIFFTNLTPTQVLAFQAFPQELAKYVGTKRWLTEIAAITLPSGINIDMNALSQQKIAALKQAIDNGTIVVPVGGFPFIALDGVHMLSAADITNLYTSVVHAVQATYSVAADLIAQINATTITTRAQIDAAFAAISNS